MTRLPPVARSLVRIVAGGLVAASLAGAVGVSSSRSTLGTTDAEALARIGTELDRRFGADARALEARASRIRERHARLWGPPLDAGAVKELFSGLDAELPEDLRALSGITVFDATGAPLAWVGRVSDLPRDRIDGPSALFMTLDILGPRLVLVRPVDGIVPPASRVATIVVEQLVAPATGPSAASASRFLLPTSVVDVEIRTPSAGPTPTSPYVVPVRSGEGELLGEAAVSPESLQSVRVRWREGTHAAVLGVLAIAVLLCAARVLAWRGEIRTTGAAIAATLTVVALLGAARVLVWWASAAFIGPSLSEPLALLPNGLLLVGVVWLALDGIERRRVAAGRVTLQPVVPATYLRVGAGHLLAAALATAMLAAYQDALRRTIEQSPLDVLDFSLHPVEPVRLSAAFGLVLLHAGMIWAAAAVLRLPVVAWRTPRVRSLRAVTSVAALAGVAAMLVASGRETEPLAQAPLLVALGLAAFAAVGLSRPRGALRRASQSARLGALFVALLAPAVAFYPSLNAFAVAAKERLVADEFAPQAARQREDLQSRFLRAQAAIDEIPSLAAFVTSSSVEATPTTDRAFIVWSQTELATSRTTSAVELYGPNGRLVSWFALNLPEYGTTSYQAARCDAWAAPYEETSPFGSSLRNVLRASRAICDGGRRVGAIVVRAMLDYRSLPFISAESPYREAFGGSRAEPPEGAFGRDVEFAVYGWSRATLYSSSTRVWPLADVVVDRMTASRAPFWTPVTRDGERFRVFFFNDRNGIYALGYPVTPVLGHLINLGELVFLAGVLYTVLLILVTTVHRLTRRTRGSGRSLLREVRSSFYRKLFIAFVASAVVPVVVLAVATRSYFANRYLAGLEDAAVKTALVAQRLVEDYAALQQRGASSLDLVDDQVMVLVRRAIDQDVNLFDRWRLQATSERPLFASHFTPARTPSRVYQSIVLDRMPTSIGIEEIAGLPYLVAAAPVRTGGREGIVTVPQPLRSREIEEEGDELDRRVLSASVLFVLLGSAIGYWMAERIADPVNRLTRATRRIARGDLDARIATTSSDELRRLVEDFNRMADDLKRQRADLERTQRLEAWADMARQVAHDIKNPLTPIQLSAEHASRINRDRGEPLSPVLDECVAVILSQVQLLRQISAEFSSFASSPTPRPEPVDLAALVNEVVAPYRSALVGRVAIEVSAGPALPLVRVDRTLFARALTNVIENALHAMPGGGTLAITTAWQPVDRHPPVVVHVRDTGPGMEPEAMARLFEPYFSTKATGTGLGLTIAKRNVELNGGTIAVHSVRGSGTTVELRLPVAVPAQEGG